MDAVVVGIADGKTVKHPGKLVTYALGSCVGICLYDPLAKVAGMVHILLPYQKEAVNAKNSYKFADAGVLLLIREMEKMGALRSRMTAKLAGGAEMFQYAGAGTKIGMRNVQAAKEALRQAGIKISAEDTGENHGRTIWFSAETGELEVRRVGGRTMIL
ncbi:chemotaxis protein CheD [Clostridium sp. MCC353]|uniref:chemotaxis protein CheD n=1 Tax=Clostridium sp. MCC353 TaxID=2592646 RepID=UPI001C0279D7|nr:chemotaxis protein CheD [Clostridium sp. MCC353]MBT9777829.1 chemotaxis protein CheD [Clostridium sp. MCC353]